MFFQIIESSSAGNCSYLEYDGVKVLIDAGIGVRKIEKYLASRGETLSDIDAVFITHEHTDHCRALHSLAKYHLKVFANRLTCDSIKYLDPETKSLEWRTFEDGVDFDFLGIGVCAVSIPHDTSDSVGYSFRLGDRTLVWLTDLGKLTLPVRDVAMHAQVLVLESNYCPVMLDSSSRPYRLKARIKGSHGHLSNADAISLLKTLPAESVEKVYLAHISRECNSTSHISDLLSEVGALRDRIEIVSPFSVHSTPFEM